MKQSTLPHAGLITAAVVPIKSLQQSKQRLARLFNQQQRADLSLAMLKDILGTLTRCRDIQKIVLVTSDTKIQLLAQRLGIEVLTEQSQTGLINAVSHAGKTLSERGIHRMLFIPADVPLVTEQEIQRVLNPIIDVKELTHRGVVHIVPATASGGSNCISCMPANCMQFSFGEQSFVRHLNIARESNLNTIVTKLPGLGLDVDTPADLAQLTHQLMALKNIEFENIDFESMDFENIDFESGDLENGDLENRDPVKTERKRNERSGQLTEIGKHTYRFLLDSGILKHLQSPICIAE